MVSNKVLTPIYKYTCYYGLLCVAPPVPLPLKFTHNRRVTASGSYPDMRMHHFMADDHRLFVAPGNNTYYYVIVINPNTPRQLFERRLHVLMR